MPIQRAISPDLQGSEICEFLHSDIQTRNNKNEVVNEILAGGYQLSTTVDRSAGSFSHTIPTNIRRFIKLLTPVGRLVRRCEIVDLVSHAIDLEIRGTLLIKQGLDPAIQKKIEDVFSNTLLDDVEINQAEADLLADGVAIDDYYLALYFALIKTAPPNVGSINFDSFVGQMKMATDASGAPLYLLAEEDVWGRDCEITNNEFPDDDVLTVPDAENARDDIKEDENKNHPGCDGLEVTDHRIGTAFQHLEWKTEWEMREVRIGRCTIMKTKLPILYHRIRKYALWGIAMTRAETKRNAEKAITSCLILAAINTAALAIVTGGLGLAAAAQAFVASALICMESKISDTVNCFFVSLKLVAEIGDWKEGPF